jgi:hypothetical protein
MVSGSEKKYHLATTFALVVIWLSTTSSARGTTLQFDNMFGPCGNNSFIIGPQNVSYGGVTFATPDSETFNIGPDYYTQTPFTTDYFLFFNYGSGTTITFPSPITFVSFDAAEYEGFTQYPTFDLIQGGQVQQIFGANITSITHVSQSFATPISSINIKFINGSASNLGMDNLTFSVPEPASITSMFFFCASMTLRRRSNR